MDEFNISQALYPEKPEELDKFEIEITDEWDNGAGFSADITHGMVQFSAENDGKGKRNRYFAHTEKGKELFNEFRERSQRAFPNSAEPEDLAILWLEIRSVIDSHEEVKPSK